MQGLKKYDAVNDLTIECYKEILSIVRKKEDEVEMFSRMAAEMGGLFWSEKFQNVLCGTFEIQNKLKKTEFINRLKVSKNGKSKI